MRADELGQLDEAELLRRYREAPTIEERRAAGHELDLRRHATEMAKARAKPPRLATRRKYAGWHDGAAAASGAGNEREDE